MPQTTKATCHTAHQGVEGVELEPHLLVEPCEQVVIVVVPVIGCRVLQSTSAEEELLQGVHQIQGH